MGLVTPSFGLFFWMLLTFSAVLFLLGKFAWKPIMKSLKDREDSIDEALKSAQQAKEEMKQLHAKNDALLNQAREERDNLLKEARAIKDSMINEAKDKAVVEADRILKAAKESIENEKKAAMNELRTQVATLSVEIAEKLIKQTLADSLKQKEYIETLMKESRLN